MYKRPTGQPAGMTHKFKFYADDGKLVVERGTDRDDDDMQSDINKIVNWGETCAIDSSPEKYKVMHIRKQSNSVDYFIAGKLSVTAYETDLDVLVSADGTWHEQVNCCIKGKLGSQES